MSFPELGLAKPLLRAIEAQGYSTPTPIQAQAIPMILEGHDLLAAAQTGTGKTAAFTLPLLHRLAAAPRPGGKAARVLVLTPTRELAAQVHQSVLTYGEGLKLRSVVIFGGVGAGPQRQALQRGVDLIIATPGRLLDHHRAGDLDLSRIETLVLDEADRMLDMGFIHDIKRIIAALPRQRQNLLFSATFSGDIRKLAHGLLHQPREVNVAPRNAPAELVEQHLVRVDKADKRTAASRLISENNWRQVLVFTRTKHGANRLAKQLESDGLSSAAIHGNKSQGARTRALDGFKRGEVRVLVATDIAARGIDIDQLPHVINFDLPNVAADYVHRIGRTGRAGQSGSAVSLVDHEEIPLLRDIQRLLGREIPELTLNGINPGPTPAANQDPGRTERSRQAPRQGRNAAAPGRGRSPAGGRGAAAAARPRKATSSDGAGTGAPAATPRSKPARRRRPQPRPQ